MTEARRVRAAICRSLDGPDAVEVGEIDLPPTGPGEVRLRVRACSVNFPDLLMTRGLYQHKAEPPFVPGLEAAGEVLEVGEGVTGWAVGDRAVALTSAAKPGMAEEIVVPAEALLPTPPSLSDAEAASLFVGHYTAWNGAVDRGGLAAGETMVVLGAAGGVGLATVQVGKAMGARVIAVASSEEKRRAAMEEGADHALASDEPELKAKVFELTGGEGADLVYDIVGGRLFKEGIRMLRPEGRLAVIGFASGEIGQTGANMVLIKEISLIGVRAGQYGRRHPERRLEAWRRMGEWVAEGRFRPRIWKTFPLERAADALRELENRAAIGKVVVTVG